MNRIVLRNLIMSSVVVASMASRSMAQTAHITITNNGVPQNYVINSDGAFLQNDDGSLQQVDPNSVPGLAARASTFQQQIGQINQRNEQTMRDALGCSDPEWALLWPKIQKIQAIQNALGFKSGPSPTAAKGGGTDLPSSVTTFRARVQEFRKLAYNKDVAASEVTGALASVRDARDKVEADLRKAQRELTDLLTPHQEAILFDKGILTD